MPIHLPPLSRREFLGKAILAGAGVALTHCTPAKRPAADSDLWALLADTHIAEDRATVARGINMTDHLIAVGGQVARADGIAGVIIAGDCAYLQGMAGDYSTVLGLLEPMRAAGLPIHLLLGNHDARDNFRAAIQKNGESADSPVADKHVALLKTPRANFFLLDSLDQTNVTPGRIGEAQLSWLAGALDANTDRPAIIIAHHHPELYGVKNGAVDTPALMDLLVPRKHVKAYVFGHTHVWGTLPHESGIHLVNLPPVAYVFKQGLISGWVSAALRDGGATLTLRSTDGMHPDEGKAFDLEWRA
ncbi:MAG TPA: metallophosphoesterase [Verrucomicrobiae bacterium]|nr:metallophosphoesterase [Verrucomicrobiae bacterium]